LTIRYRDRLAFWGIEVLNEPISPELWKQLDIPNRYPAVDPEEAAGSEPVPTEFLKGFYRQAYRRIRGQSDEVMIVFHDGFRIREWDGYFDDPEFQRIIVDTHLYLMVHTWTSGNEDLEGYLAYIRDEFAATLNEMSARLPIVVGEWCLDTMSPKASKLGKLERLDFYRSLATAQLQAWESTQGWFYWSYKLLTNGSDLDGWDTGKSMELGYLPHTLKL
jgi:glucan 1,3-beta-glucosidase